MKARTLHCSFCHEAGHYWPTCSKKLSLDALFAAIVQTVVEAEVDAYFRPAARTAMRVGLRAYSNAAPRWRGTGKLSLYSRPDGRRVGRRLRRGR